MEPSRIAVPSSSHLIEPEEDKAYEGLGITTVKLLHTRELCGNVTTSARGKCNFRDEYTNILASKPVIWKYSVRENISRALEQVEVIAHMPNGEFRTDLLISGDINGTLRYHVIDKDTTQIFPSGVRSTPEYAWPLDIENKDEVAKSPGHLWTLGCSNSFGRGNPIGCLKKMGKPGQQKILITAVGSVYVLRLNDPLMLDGRFSNTSPNLLRIADINFRILDADCNSDGSRALFGTNKGVTIMDLETGVASRVCSCTRPGIRAVQLVSSEKIALCGLENGAIVSVDTRQPHKHAWFTPTLNLQSLIMHSKRGRFELHGNIYESRTLSLSPPRFTSSISCLTSLKLYKQYFLASSEDGTMKLYDHRMVERGAVLSYRGDIGLNDNIQHAVDPSEKFVVSGGTDGKVGLWSVKSGELLFEERFMDSIPSQFCWGIKEDNGAKVGSIYNQHSNFGEAWIGGLHGLYLMRW